MSQNKPSTELVVARKNPHAVALGRKGGRVKSAAKAVAVRLNGLKGGRPKKSKQAEGDSKPANVKVSDRADNAHSTAERTQ